MLGPTITLDTIVETLVIGVGTLSGEWVQLLVSAVVMKYTLENAVNMLVSTCNTMFWCVIWIRNMLYIFLPKK